MRKRSARILMGFGIAIVAVSLLYAVAVAVSATKLRQAYAAMERDGRPTSVAEIIPPTVPDWENAALLYESATLLLRATPTPKQGNLLRYLAGLAAEYTGNSPDPSAATQLQQFLQHKEVSQAFSILAEATRRPACRFNHAYYSKPFVMISSLVETRDLARLLAAKACLEANTAEPNTAWETVQTLLTISGTRRTEPLLSSQFVRISSIGLSCRTIQRLCETALPTDAQYRRLTSHLETLDDIQPIVRAADGERLFSIEPTFALPRDQLYKILQDKIFWKGYWSPLANKLYFAWTALKLNLLSDHTASVRLMTEEMRLLEQPYSRESRERLNKEYAAVPSRYLLTHMLLPGMQMTSSLYYRMIANVHITRAGLALLHYRATHGNFPATLTALDLQNIDDPFSGKPLLYRPEGKGFVLYSVGEDQKDNGGIPRPERRDSDPRKRHAEYDLVWRFPASPEP